MLFWHVGHTGPSAAVDVGVLQHEGQWGLHLSTLRAPQHPGKAALGQGGRSAELSRAQIRLGNVDDLEAPVVPRSQFGNCGALFPPCSKGGSARELSVAYICPGSLALA